MLKKQNIKASRRKKSQLQNTIGEIVQVNIIKTGLKTAKETGLAASNKTKVIVKIAQKTISAIDKETELINSIKSKSAFARIMFKATKYIARGQSLCTKLCVILKKYEVLALECLTIKKILFQGRIYVVPKIISKSCKYFKNACAGKQC